MIGLLLLGRITSIPDHVYLDAGQRWIDHLSLYDLSNIDGFQYFPQSALLLSVFSRLGSPWGAIFWRALGWGLYALAIWRFTHKLTPTHAAECFLLTTALAIGPSIGNLSNGQANLILAALMSHVAVDLIEHRWWRATAILALGFALKPLMIVLLLLCIALYRPLIWRLPLALGVVFAAPFLLRDNAYVMAQYSDCLAKLKLCENPDRLFEDTRGLLASVGWLLSHATYLVVRGCAAVATFGLCWLARTRCRDPRTSFLIAAFAASYLMLFNPRTLSTSYVMVGSSAALLASVYLLQRRWRPLSIMLGILFAWTLSYHVVGFVEHWLRPLACFAFCIVLTREALAPQEDPPLRTDAGR
jgi:hypothetical protein